MSKKFYENLTKKVEKAKLRESKIKNINEDNFIYIVDDGSSFSSLKEALEWVKSEDGINGDVIIKEQIDCDDDELELCESKVVWTRENGELKEELLKEGTANFYTPKYLPLLIFIDYDEVVYDMQHDEDYPNIDDFDDSDKYDEARYDFEDEYLDKFEYCILDESEIDKLRNELDDFNIETKEIAEDKDIDEEGYQQYSNNLNLEDITLTLKPGYYSGVQIDVVNEDSFDYLDEDFKEEQLERFNKFLKELKEKYGLTELQREYIFSNGETGYSKVESLKEEKEEDYIYYIVSDGKNPRHSIAFTKNQEEDALRIAPKYKANYGYVEVLKYTNGNPEVILKNEEVEPVEIKKPKGFAGHKDSEIKKDVKTNPIEEDKSHNKEYTVEVLYSEDGNHVTSFKVKSSKNYDSSKILNKFFKEHPNYKDDMYKVQITESLNESVKKDSYIYLFPDSPAMGDYKDDCKKFNLEFLGKNYYGIEKNLVIRGTEKDLRKYAEYLDYDLHPDYLYKEEDFAGEILPLKDKKVRESYSLLGAEDKNIELYSNYYTAKKRAEELGLKLAEYGDLYNSDICYCYWNKSGNRFDDEEVICYYFFENGKPKHSVSQEELNCIAREIGLSVKDIDDADAAELEDEIDESEKEICEEWFCTVFDKEGNAKDFDSYEEAEKYGIETYGEGNFTIESPFQQSSIEESNNSSNVDIERCKEIVSQLTDYNSLSDEEIQSMIDDGIVVDEDMWITELRNLFSEDEITEDEYDYILNHIEELKESCSKNTKKSNLNEDYSGFLGNYGFDYLRGIGDFEYWYFKDEKGFEEAVERIRKEYPKLIVSSSPSDKTIYIQKSKYGTKESVTESKKEVKPFTKSQVMTEIKRDTVNFSKDFEGHYGFEEEANIAEKILTKRGYDVDYHTEDSKLEKGKTEYIIVATKTHVNESLEEDDVEYKGFTIKPLVIDSIMYGDKKLPGFTKYVIMKGDKYLPDEVYDLFKKDNKLETIDDYKKLIDNIKIKEDYSEDYYDDDYKKLLKRIAKSLKMPYRPESEDDYDNWNYVSLLHDCNNGRGNEWIEIFEKENLDKSLLKEFKRLLRCISKDEDFILEENKKNKTKKRTRFVGDMNAEMKFFNDSVGNTSLGGTSGE